MHFLVLVIGAAPLLCGFLLDLLLGDPRRLPHPVRWIGALICRLERVVRKRFDGHLYAGGTLLAAVVLLLSAGVPLVLLVGCYRWNLFLGAAVESVLCYYLLAARSLQRESMRVCHAVEAGRIEAARTAVSGIVGRDTDRLDAAGILKAAVETVAENTTDGVTAPLFYMMLGGAVLGFFHKAASTMDSMIGYRTERYAALGRFAARLDDALNWVPARITALLMILSAFLLGYDGKSAFRIWLRDRRCHASPNAAQTESVCAGALHLQLGGDAWYFGKRCKKATIGDDCRPIEAEDVRRANRLLYCTAAMMLAIAAAGRAAVLGGILCFL